MERDRDVGSDNVADIVGVVVLVFVVIGQSELAKPDIIRFVYDENVDDVWEGGGVVDANILAKTLVVELDGVPFVTVVGKDGTLEDGGDNLIGFSETSDIKENRKKKKTVKKMIYYMRNNGKFTKVYK